MVLSCAYRADGRLVRSPSASELRHLLRRLSRELLTDGLSARAKAKLIKGVARAALKQ